MLGKGILPPKWVVRLISRVLNIQLVWFIGTAYYRIKKWVIEDIWRRGIQQDREYLSLVKIDEYDERCPICFRLEETVYQCAGENDIHTLHWSAYMDCPGGQGEAAIKCDRCGCWFIIDIST